MKYFLGTICVIFFTSLVLIDAVKIEYGDCGSEYENLVCTVDEVKVECEIDSRTKACKLKRGLNYTMNVGFTPDFDGDDITMLAYALMPGKTLAFQGMDDNACNWMQCPVVNGVKKTYTFVLSMSPKYPMGTFNVRWVMKKAGEPKCCFVNRFKIY